MTSENLPSKQKVSVAIVAIAKNESAYLAEWVHHHKHFGFDGIYIGINRTTDRSDEVIQKIQKKHDDVFALNVDWIDSGCPQNKSPDFQSMSYAYMTKLILDDEKAQYTHIIYLDIDEFWFCTDFQTDIKKYIRSLPEFDAMSFNWLMQPGDPIPFSRPFENLLCTPVSLLKSLITTELAREVIQYRAHFPQISSTESPYIRLDSNGVPFVQGKHQEVSAAVPDLDSKAFVLHRAHRSEKEYIALLRRERPGLELPIKSNRSGFSLQATSKISLDPTLLKTYWDDLDKFIKAYEIDSTLAKAKKRVYLLCDTILDIEPQRLILNVQLYIRVLQGTFMEVKILQKLEESEDAAIWSKNGPIFHGCANYYKEKQRYDIALRYINLALLCRPEGPAILATANELQKLANVGSSQAA